jgi:type I restriction enzyme R subunit
MTPEYRYAEQPAIRLFQQLGYHYYDASRTDDERTSINDIILENRLKNAIQRINPWLDENNLKIALRKITAVQGTSLMGINRKIHELLRGPATSVKQTINGRMLDKSISYIDYQDIQNNDFLVVNQMKFKGKGGHSIPDITVFINGLPIAVIECKSPKVQNAASEAVSDLLYYQRNSPKLFYYNQVCAGIYKVGGKYGAISAEELYYNVYKCSDTQPISQLLERPPTPQDILLYHLFKKEYLLDIIRNFILFETNEGKIIKKLPRYTQIRTVNKAIQKLKTEDKGGVIWHTQGSGKSISMVYLATKLRRDELGFKNPTIIVMTDRRDLDDQISKTFKNCRFPNPIQAGSIKKLGQLLRDPYGKTIMTTLQKFQETDENGNVIKTVETRDKQGNFTCTKRIIDNNGHLVKVTTVKNPEGKKINEHREIMEVPELSCKENVFVFVDEAHRSHYGFLAAFMRKALPNARFLAFTGTPIDKENKSTLAEFYGGKYLDVYTIKESVEDGATLKIFYDAGLPELYVEKELIDRHFEKEFSDRGPQKKERLRQKAAGLDAYMNARQRIERIAQHIIEHYRTKIFPDGLKAMVVCHSREAAAAYKDAFDQLAHASVHNFATQLIMTLDTKKDPEHFQQLATHPVAIKKAVEDFKLPFGDETQLAKDGKKQYDNIAITIVCDMLLTGYDVPIVQVMYLDKLLTEHNLLQAIARVNRTRKGKTAGFVIDYCGITQHLSRALAMFSEDLKSHEVMEKPLDEIERLELRHRQLVAFFSTIKENREKERELYIDKAVHYLEPEDRRDEFITLLKKFNQSLNILLPSPEALKYEYDFKLYNEIKLQAGNMYVDDSLRVSREESKKIQAMVDKHLRAVGISYLLDSPVSIIDREKFEEEIRKTLGGKSRELKIIHRIRHIIKVNMDKNPEFYRPLSKRLEELINQRRQERIDQMKLFKELEEIQEKIVNKQNEGRKLGFTTDAQFAVYKTLETLLKSEAIPVTNAIFQSITDELRIDNWQNKGQVKKTMRLKIKEHISGKVPAAKKDQVAKSLLAVIESNPGE